jgi:uncharacterized Tic20 family protein
MDENQVNNPSPNQPENVPPQPEQPSGPTPPPPGGSEPTKEAKNMAMLAHILGFFTSVIGPLIIWLMKKDEHPYIEQQAREALNFQITVLIAGAVAGVLTLVCVGVILAVIIPIVDIIFCIMAAVAASNGKDYRYPFALRLVK